MHLGRRNPRTSLRRDVEADGANTMEPKQQKFSIWYVLAALLASSITTDRAPPEAVLFL